MIVGVHSCNQLIYGFAIGLWTLAYVLNYWRPLARKHMRFMKSKSLTRKRLSQLLTTIGIFSTLSLILLTIVYQVMMANYVMPKEYVAGIQSCDPTFDPKKDLSGENLFVAGVMMLPFGIYCGVAFRYYKLEANVESEEAPLLRNRCSVGSVTKRLFFFLLMILPPIGL